MATSSDSTRSERAREAFAAALEKLDRGEAFDFETFCGEQPELELELRSLHASWRDVERVFGGLAADAARACASREIDAASQLDLERFASPDRSSSRYERVERIAEGGMGVIWRVFDRDLQRELALKSMRLPDAPDGRLVRRFLSEARLAGRFDHPGILPVHDIGVDRFGELYFTMPLVRGSTLDRVLEHMRHGTEGWTLVRAIEVLLRVCDAMDCAHTSGVIHRDLKPANIMVGRFGETYVMDWGLALAADESDAGAVLGTPAYMSPEQARGGRVDARADVYAIGAMLYHLLTGQAPYARAGESQSGDDVLRELRERPPESIEALAPKAPPELAAISAKAMSRELDARYGSVREMSNDLRAFVENRVVRAHQIGAWPELKKWVRRNQRLAWAIAASITIAIGGLAWVSYVEKRSNAEILRLSDVRRLAELERRADELWPAVPQNASEMERWLMEAHELAANRTIHRQTLQSLRVSTRVGDAWRRDVLEKLVADLDRFADAGSIASVERRLAFAHEIARTSIEEHAGAWHEAIAAIADERQSPQYAGLSIEPQLGLVPIGRDPSSGLWEFAHLASGVPPQRTTDGALVVRAESSLVFVLIPAGNAAIGSLRPTPGQPSTPRTDRLAQENETPVRTVALSAFFVSKYEMTRAQWQRLAELDASSSVSDPLAPATEITWTEARRVLGHVALALPTEAQWEYAARAGTTTRWSYGDEISALAAAVNAGAGIDASLPYEDGYAGLAPVDALAPNTFGLHHVHGNAREWTLDAYAPEHAASFRAGDGLADNVDTGARTARGGGFASSIAAARSAARIGVPLENRDPEIGVRPARSIDR